MQVLFFMIGISLTMAIGFLVAFFWAIRHGQNEDLFTPSIRMLLDDEVNTQTDIYPLNQSNE